MEIEQVNVKLPSFDEPEVEQKVAKKKSTLKVSKVVKEEPFDAHYDEDAPEGMDPDYKKRFDRDHKMVRGQFTYPEVPGGTIRFSFLKYKEDEVKHYEFYDGEVKEIPLMVAEHINQKYYPVHEHLLDENGKRSVTIGRKVYRASFRSLDFITEDIEARPNLIQISRAI